MEYASRFQKKLPMNSWGHQEVDLTINIASQSFATQLRSPRFDQLAKDSSFRGKYYNKITKTERATPTNISEKSLRVFVANTATKALRHKE